MKVIGILLIVFGLSKLCITGSTDVKKVSAEMQDDGVTVSTITRLLIFDSILELIGGIYLTVVCQY